MGLFVHICNTRSKIKTVILLLFLVCHGISTFECLVSLTVHFWHSEWANTLAAQCTPVSPTLREGIRTVKYRIVELLKQLRSTLQWLYEVICDHVPGWTQSHTRIIALNSIRYKMVMNADLLCSLSTATMTVLLQQHCALVVLVNNSIINPVTLGLQKIVSPQHQGHTIKELALSQTDNDEDDHVFAHVTISILRLKSEDGLDLDDWMKYDHYSLLKMSLGNTFQALMTFASIQIARKMG